MSPEPPALRYVLDTHVLIWYFTGNRRLPELGHIAEHVLNLVLDTAVACGVWELAADGAEHGRVAVRHPQVYLPYAAQLELVTQVLPGRAVFAFTHRKGQHLAFAGQADTDDGQNRHLVSLSIIDHAEVGAIGEEIAVACLQGTILPALKLGCQRMMYPRYGRRTRLLAGQPRQHVANLTLAGAGHEHAADGLVRSNRR